MANTCEGHAPSPDLSPSSTEKMATRASSDPVAGMPAGEYLRRVSKYIRRGDIETFYEKLAVASFRRSSASVSLSKPDLPDCPLIGVSAGFEKLTGYGAPEIIGKNCRFLNRGCPMRADVRQELRIAVKTHLPVVCLLSNRRRNGEFFSNLLHMSSLRIGRSWYILGIQKEVDGPAQHSASGHIGELNSVVDRILATVEEAWAELEPTLLRRRDARGEPRGALAPRPGQRRAALRGAPAQRPGKELLCLPGALRPPDAVDDEHLR